MGASLAWAGAEGASRSRWRERRDLFPEGVASGDPDPQSVILWTRRPFDRGQRHVLTVEVAAGLQGSSQSGGRGFSPPRPPTYEIEGAPG
jgi:phosphodiesterase/alkaline phosphatase D-like protein